MEDYSAKIKASLLLPKTDFPMRAELPKREPATLAKWREEKVYDQIMAARAGGEKFVLHDGPPFANGDAHMGHALNMVLKDIVLKYHNMSGHYAPFVPGWDCHGLPIEHKVMKELGAAETDPMKIREKCEATARHFVGVQSEQFQRLGVFGDWANPYLTLDPKYEAETLRVFATLVEKGLVYQGLRPVLWSTGCQTALAEAEIEYKEKVDPAVFVKFSLTVPDLRENFHKQVNLGITGDVSLLIWTTTPWTLPANLAVAVAPNLEYGLYRGEDGSGLIFLKDSKIYERTFSKVEAPEHRFSGVPEKVFKGSDLVGLTYTHPFLADGKTRQIFPADFVTADAGTGLVHIAPGHGQDDYQLGMQHGLEAFSPVDDRGCLTAAAGVPELTGQYVFKANPLIIALLKDKGLLFAEEQYTHDYPYCWRSKTPIVYRAVKQWFIKVDAFRAQALGEIEKVEWIPANGKNRIRGAVESRPDWCISRQRTWGVPLPVFYQEDGTPLLSEKIVRDFAALVEKEGTGIWFARTADELAAALGLPAGLRKGNDTLDVWIDSGTSWAAVVAQRPELRGTPADLYLEGSDQHRGWFQSSLLTSVAATGKAPYRAVLTNGFVVDTDRKKLSKSNEGYQKPVDLMSLVNGHGADVLRLWVASQDYQNDIPFSHEILARIGDTYRSIRNRLRFLHGNLHDFHPTNDVVADPVQWTSLDRLYYQKYLELGIQVEESYGAHRFSQVYQLINKFCEIDLSKEYFEMLKDRLYCHSRNDPERRASQTVINYILNGLLRYLSPIIPFTTQEMWTFWLENGYGVEQSLHTQEFPRTEMAGEQRIATSVVEGLFKLRDRVNAKLENARREKLIGKSLEAIVEISQNWPEGASSYVRLEEFFIVSKVILTPTDGEETITVTRAEDHGMKKCIRCWKYWDHVGSHAGHPELCDRCTKVVVDLGF